MHQRWSTQLFFYRSFERKNRNWNELFHGVAESQNPVKTQARHTQWTHVPRHMIYTRGRALGEMWGLRRIPMSCSRLPQCCSFRQVKAILFAASPKTRLPRSFQGHTKAANSNILHHIQKCCKVELPHIQRELWIRVCVRNPGATFTSLCKKCMKILAKCG